MGKDAQSPHKINYTLSAIFYSLATGFVPNSLWKKLSLSPKQASSRLSSIARKDIEIITIHRKLTQTQILTRNLNTIISGVFKSVTVPFILLPTLFAIGLISGVAISKTILFQQNFPTPKPSISPKPSPTPKPSIFSKPVPTPKSQLADWPTTSKALDSLRDELANAHKLPRNKVENAIVQALLLTAAYQFKNGKNEGKDNSEIWIKGIQSFQDKTGNYTVYGSITVNDYTYNLLKCEVAKKLKIVLKILPSECSSNP